MESLENFLADVSSFVWGPWLLIPLLLLTGLYLTILLRGLQFRHFRLAFWLAFFKRKEDDDVDGDIAHYQALTTALAATVGVGNIAGVATAIALGGPGAVFWMWFTGLVGMATKYSEAFLGVRFRRTDAAGSRAAAPCTTCGRASRAVSAGSWAGSSRSPAPSRPSASGTWCRPTPSPRTSRTSGGWRRGRPA